MKEHAIIIFQENPVPGKVKTRLGEVIGSEKAVEVYEYLLHHTHELVKDYPADVFVYFLDKVDDDYPKGHPQVAQVAIQQADNLAHNLKAVADNRSMKKFKYKDLGSMATVGRKLAVVDLPFIKFQGFTAWITWLFVHLMAIVGVKNRILIFMDWAWNYLSFDPALRLLIRPRYVKPKEQEELVEEKHD